MAVPRVPPGPTERTSPTEPTRRPDRRGPVAISAAASALLIPALVSRLQSNEIASLATDLPLFALACGAILALVDWARAPRSRGGRESLIVACSSDLPYFAKPFFSRGILINQSPLLAYSICDCDRYRFSCQPERSEG